MWFRIPLTLVMLIGKRLTVGLWLCVKRILASVVCNLTPASSTFKLKWGGSVVVGEYSITTGRTLVIAEVSRRQPLEYWKIGPKVLANGKLRREQLMLVSVDVGDVVVRRGLVTITWRKPLQFSRFLSETYQRE